MDNHKDMVVKYLEVPVLARGTHYNEQSGLIILNGPRGPLLARYPHPDMPPDPERFKFQTQFCRDYTVFEKTEPPNRAPADVTATAHPIEKNKDPRLGVHAGPSSDPSGKTGGPKESSIMQTPNTGDVQPLPEMKGMQITESRTDIRGQDAGLVVGNKVKVDGEFEKGSTTQKGLTKQSPLDGTIPETAITFPAAADLPDIQKIQKLRSIVKLITNLPTLIGKLINAGDELI